MNDEHRSGDQVEVLALTRAMALIEVAADPAGAAKRIKSLSEAAAKLAAERRAAEAVMAEADVRSAELAKGEASLTQRIADTQAWIDASERSYRQREDHVRRNEEAQEQREGSLVEKETELAKRESVHRQRVDSLRANLA
jgi:phage-related minor tail protein